MYYSALRPAKPSPLRLEDVVRGGVGVSCWSRAATPGLLVHAVDVKPVTVGEGAGREGSDGTTSCPSWSRVTIAARLVTQSLAPQDLTDLDHIDLPDATTTPHAHQHDVTIESAPKTRGVPGCARWSHNWQNQWSHDRGRTQLTVVPSPWQATLLLGQVARANRSDLDVVQRLDELQVPPLRRTV